MSRSVIARDICESVVCTESVLACTSTVSVVCPTSSFTGCENTADTLSSIPLMAALRNPPASG